MTFFWMKQNDVDHTKINDLDVSRCESEIKTNGHIK